MKVTGKGRILNGVAHIVPKDLKLALLSSPVTLVKWNEITPLARNEWICWIQSAKMQDTKNRRIERVSRDLAQGKKRPCCWAGCPHR